MSDVSKESGGGKIAKWFLKKLFTTPALYIGATCGVLAGTAFASKGPMSGAIGFGSMVGFVSGFIAFVVINLIKAFYQNAQNPPSNEQVKEYVVIAELQKLDLKEDAVLLERLIRERDVVAKRCAERNNDADADHTLSLVNAIVAESFRGAEELQDLIRRKYDPVLDAPQGVDEKIGKLREDFKEAYQAVADAGSRLRRGEQLKEVDFLADDQAFASPDLSALTAKLREETAISTRVEERLHPEIESRIVESDRVAIGDETANRDSESN